MKQPDFEELLAGYRQSGVPALPSSFSSHVLREIRARSAEAGREQGWLSALVACLRPGMVAAGLSVAISVGILLPGLTRGDDHALAAAGLGLDIFSPAASNLPSGLLEKNR